MTGFGPWASRGVVAAVLVPTAALSLPVAALVLDGTPARGNVIIPAQLVGLAGIGAAVDAALPHMVSETASHGRGAVVGAGIGVGLAVAADIGFLALISG